MRFFITLLLLFGSIQTLYSQQAIPVYRSPQDSVKLALLMKQINDVRQQTGKQTARIADSLFRIYQELQAEAVIAYRYQYTPNETHTLFDSLLAGKMNPEDVRRLSIVKWKNKKLPREIYACRNIERLELIETSLNRLPSKLQRLRKLKQISIYNNRSAGRLKFAPNKTITKLRIRSEKPEWVPLRYSSLKNLDTLDLSRNRITSFPSIERNLELSQLMLAENNLTLENLPAKPHPSLQHLSLHRNKIVRVPAELGNFARMKKLVLTYNEITDIDPSLSRMNELEELALYQNRLKKIPPVIYSFSNLKFLDLYFNEITKIDDDISRLQKLEILYLSFNKLYAISDKIGELQNLRELYLHHNSISLLPPSLQNLSKLEIFRFNSNHLVNVPQWIAQLEGLKNIDFSDNRIQNAPGELVSMPKLEIVAMTGNPWTSQEAAEDLADALTEKGVVVHLESKD